MTYRIRIAITNAMSLEIEDADLASLVTRYRAVGGDGDWLKKQAHAAVFANEQGSGVHAIVAGIPGSVAEGTPPVDADVVADEDDPNWGMADGEEGPADPWADDAGEADPWADQIEAAPPTASRATANRKAGAGGGSASASAKPPTTTDGGMTSKKDRFGNVWTIGVPDAPFCECGDEAARLKAKSKAGKPYTVFKCAKGAPDGDWRNKCDFSEFPS